MAGSSSARIKVTIIYDIELKMSDLGVVQILEGIKKANLNLNTSVSFLPYTLKDLAGHVNNLIEQGVDIIITLTSLPPRVIDLIAGHNIPLIAGRTNIEDPRVHTVQYDTRKIGALTAEYFVKKSCVNNALFLGPLADGYNNKRTAYYTKQGYDAEMARSDKGINTYYSSGDWSRDITLEIYDFLDRGVKGFFCQSQHFTDKTMDVLYKKQLSIPNDVLVVANCAMDSIFPFTNIGVPFKEIGESIMNLIPDIINTTDFPPQRIVLEPVLRIIG